MQTATSTSISLPGLEQLRPATHTPKVTAAIAEQAGRIIHSQINVYRHDKLEPLANKLAEITPEGIDTFYFGSTSDEIVEASVKLAKHATGRRNVIAFDGAFHGRTHYALAMSSSRAIDRAGYGPLPGSVFIAPFPDPHSSDQEREVSRALRGLDRVLSTQVASEQVAAFVIEPVIGERGYIPTPKGFMEGLAHRCEEHGILLIADETQSGFGRTGKMFAIEALGVQPDIICSWPRGFPQGSRSRQSGTRRALDEQWVTGSHSGSSNGKPDRLWQQHSPQSRSFRSPVSSTMSRSEGDQLIDALREMQQLDQALLHVRGRGLMVATEFDSPERAQAVVDHCFQEHNVILMIAGTFRRTIRWSPPLIVTPGGG